jgi:ABC-2 type transport system permease protein
MTTLAAPAHRPARPMHGPWLRLAGYALRRRRRAPLTWGLPLGLMAVMIVAVFPSIQGSAQLDELIKAYPDALKQAFGISDASFSSLSGYLAAEIFSMIAPFAAAAFMVNVMVAGVTSAERRGVLDVMLSAPMRRRQLIAGQLAGGAVALLGIAAVLGLLMQAAAAVFGVGLPVRDTLAGVLNLWPLGLFAGGLTALLAGLWRRPAAVSGGAAGVLVAMYLVEVLGKLSDVFAAIDGLSAFHYYGSAIEDGLDPGASAILIGAGLLLAIAGCVLFERRDVG